MPKQNDEVIDYQKSFIICIIQSGAIQSYGHFLLYAVYLTNESIWYDNVNESNTYNSAMHTKIIPQWVVHIYLFIYF